MNKIFLAITILTLAIACQNKKSEITAEPAKESMVVPTAPVVEAAPVATVDPKIWESEIGKKLMPDFNSRPSNQAEIDQNSIVEYAAKNNLDAKRTASGLYYVMEKEGKGQSPKMGESVKTNYKGYGLDGVEFDSNNSKDQPFVFTVGRGVIQGWSEGIQLLKPGGKAKLLIPSGLGWGAMGAPGAVEPNEVTVFDLSLLK